MNLFKVGIYRWWLIVLLVSGSCGYGRAQNFSKLYYDNRPSMLFGSVQVWDNNFYVSGVTSVEKPPYDYVKGLFGKINADGVLEFEKGINDGDTLYYAIFLNSLKKTRDGNFIVTGNKSDSASKSFIMKMDTACNVILWHEYTDSQQALLYQGMDIIEVRDGGYLLAINIALSSSNNNVVVLKVDSAGNVINKREYDAGSRESPWVIRSMFNGHYMIGAYTGKINGNSPYFSQTWLIEVDSMGNRVRQWIDPELSNLWPNGMKQTADSGWIIARQHLAYDSQSVQAFNGSLLKIDKNFNKQWEIDTGGLDTYAGLYDVQITPDGSYICVGMSSANINADSSIDYGWVMKVSDSGKIIWWRNYLADSSNLVQNCLNAVQLLPDGGIVACGQIQSNIKRPAQQGWLLKTDSNGCVIDQCWLTEVNEVKADIATLKIYPNPATDYAIIDYGFTDWSKGPVNLEICNALGQTVYTQALPLYSGLQKIDVSGFASGMYTVYVKRQGAVIATSKFVVNR